MLRALVIVLLLVSPLSAGWPDNRIVRFDDGGSGSFIRVGDATVILSCAHRTIDSSVQRGERINYTCGDDSQGVGTVIAVYPIDVNSNPFHDAAIYSIDRPPPADVEPFELTRRETPPNTKVWVVGFPMPAMSFRSRITRTLGYDGSLLLAGPSMPGESGGPIVNEHGEIVGTLTGVRGGNVTYACSAAVLGNLCREVETTWCQNGRCGQSQSQIYVQPQPHPQPSPAPAPAPQPTPDKSAECQQLAAKIENMAGEITSLQKQLAHVKECGCGDCCAKCDAKIAAAIAGIKIPQPQAINIDAIVAAVGARQQPFYMRVDPRADYQPIKPGQYVTLPLDRQQPK